MPKWDWNEHSLRDYFRLDTTSCLPASKPKQAYLHHSIPAWDESGGPVIEFGSMIGSNKFLISRPSILVSKLNPRKHRVTVVREVQDKLPQCASTEFMVYVPNNEKVDIRFYGWYMASEYFQGELERVAVGTTNSHARVTPRETLVWKIPVPLLPEQRHIAEILDTVHEAIRKMEALIDKLKAIKAGLLDALLTCGLDENGKLRDSVNHPEKFKNSPLSRIPSEWEVKSLGDLVLSAIDGPFGSNLKTEHYVNEPGVRVVRLQNIGTGYFNDSDKAYISSKHANSLKRYEVLQGDLIIASLGDDNHPIARACLYPTGAAFSIVKADCFRFRLDPARAIHEYVMHIFNCPSTRGDINRVAQGVTRDRVNLTTVKQVRLRIPPLSEQKRIVDILCTQDARIGPEEAYLEKLKLLKKGLMHDLLKGIVRIKVLGKDVE